MSWVEAIAVLFGLLCVWLTIRQNVWCWPTGLVQVVLYIGIFYEARLFSDVILHVIYVFMQIYGWHHSVLPSSRWRVMPAQAGIQRKRERQAGFPPARE